MTLFFFEDPFYRNFEPLSISHPVYMLLCGTSKIYEKWLNLLKCDEYGFISRPYLAGLLNLETGRKVNRIPEEDFLVINGRFIPSMPIVSKIIDLRVNEALICDDFLVAYRGNMDSGNEKKELIENLFTAEGHEKLISLSKFKKVKLEYFGYIWDLIRSNGRMIAGEFAQFKSKPGNKTAKPNADPMIKPDDIFISESAEIAPSVVIDASRGAIIVGDKARIEPFSYIQGPCYIGAECRIVGGKIRSGSSFGPMCRVGGEVEESIMLGYSNKYHEGFLGHAYLGEWVNIGALTTNSDLKNNYKEITVEIGGQAVNTGSMKIGCFIGDHTKTGIGTMLNTGINIGFSCNLYGAGLFSHKRIPSFSWGDPGNIGEYRLEKAVETASISMSRRGVNFSEVHKKLFENIYNSIEKENN